MAKAKEIAGMNCESSAAVNIELVLGVRLDEMCGLRAAALDWSDIEGVHDMRVASRRLRSALRDFQPYLRKRRLAAVAAELKRVADALGAVRDEDVAILALEELRAEAPAEIAAGISELADERRARLKARRAALSKAIRKERLADLAEEFAEAIKRAIEPRRQRKKKRSAAELSLREVAREIILARLEELRDLSAALYEPFEVDALHDMRIAAKRLRYAMQLFDPCWNKALREHAKEAAELQTSLGELHDSDVWLEDLGHMLRGFQAHRDESDAPLIGSEERKRSAAVWLMRHFAKARMKHFNNALARWDEWERGGFFKRLIAELDEGARAVELSPAALVAAEAVASDLDSRETS